MSTAKIRAHGHAVVPAQPDEMQLGLRLSFLAPTADEALSEVSRRSEELAPIFDEFGVDKKHRTTSGVSVNEEREYEKERYRHKGYRATNRVVVRFRDNDLAGRLISAATKRVQADVDGPVWRVAIDNPAREEACRQAAADAKRKARAYADALGVRLGALIRAGEPRPNGYLDSGMRVTAQASLAAADLSIEAGEMDVSAAVEVTFLIEQG